MYQNNSLNTEFLDDGGYRSFSHAVKSFGIRINGNRDMIRIFFYLCLCLFINFLDGSHQT